MNDHQPQWPSETEDEKSTPAGRRRASIWLLSCLALILIVVISAGAVVYLASRAGDDLVALQLDDEQILETPAATRQQADRPTDDPPTVELSATDEASEDTPGEQPTEPFEAELTVAAEPAIPEPSPSVTPESGATEPAATQVPPSSSTVHVSDGRIAVVDNRSQLWTVAADGSDLRLLTERGRFFQFPSWSPAGNDIAVIGSDSDGSGVYVVADEPESELRQLYSDDSALPIYLYWSPKGESVSFIASQPEGLGLHLAPADASEAAELVATSPGTFFWDWMPDGSQVLIHTGFTLLDIEQSRMAFVPLDSALTSQEVDRSGYFQAPAVAADGRYFSYSNLDSIGNRWMSVQDVEQGENVESVPHQGVVAMGFSPTSAQLAFTSPARPSRTFYGALRLIDLASGQTRLLAQEAVVAFFWSPDGRSIAYLTPAVIEEQFDFDEAPVAALSGEAVSRLPDTFEPARVDGILGKISPSNQPETRFGLAVSVVDVESGDSRELMTFEPGALFLNQFLPFFDQYAHSHRLWSPDSRSLLLPIRDEQNRDLIIVVPVDGGDPLPLAPGVAAFWSQQ